MLTCLNNIQRFVLKSRLLSLKPIFRVWSITIDGFIIKASELMDPVQAAPESNNIPTVDLELDPSYMEELNLASQEAAVEVLSIQNELMKFKSYGVHFIEWLNRSKFEKDESNHKIVTQFYNDHAATFPKLSKLEF